MAVLWLGNGWLTSAGVVTRVERAGDDCAASKAAAAVGAAVTSWMGTRVSWIITPSSVDKAFIPSRCLRALATVFVIVVSGAGTPPCQPTHPLARVINSRQRSNGRYRRPEKRHPRRCRQRISRYSPCTIIAGKTGSGRVKVLVEDGSRSAASSPGTAAFSDKGDTCSLTRLVTIC